MINNRLIADNTIKTPLKGAPYFAVSKKLIAFQIDKHIRVKTLHRQAKDIDIPFDIEPIYFSLSQMRPWLLVLTPSLLLEINLLQYGKGINQGSYKKIAVLRGVHIYRENKEGLVIGTLDRTLKILSYKQIEEKTEVDLNIDCTLLKSQAELGNSYILTTESNSERILLTKSESLQMQDGKQLITQVIGRVDKSAKQQKSLSLSYLDKILSFYRDRYVFQLKDKKQVEIIDIEESKLLGKFSLDGTVKYHEIRQNLLLIVTAKENTDYFNFFVLNPQPSSSQPLITNRACYEKGKADFIRFYNIPSTEVLPYVDKKKNVQVSDVELTSVSDSTCSLIYILNKAKEKVEIIKLDHSKLLKSPFGQEKVDMIVYSKKSEKEIKQIAREQPSQVERARVHSSMEIKVERESIEDLQKRFVQNLIDIKIKNVLKKFDHLQTRVANLEKMIHSINAKIDQNLEKANRKEIKLKVDQLFDTFTPQFEKYFTEIFKQVSGVFQQGITYYNLKLAKEAEVHKQTLTQVVSDTFKFTEQVAEIGRKEQSVSSKTEEYLKKIMQSKKKWLHAIEEAETKVKEVPSPVIKQSQNEIQKPQGKIFVRADLNLPYTRRET